MTSSIISSESGWLINHELSIAQDYARYGLRFNSSVFRVFEPFLMQSQFEKQNCLRQNTGLPTQRKRKPRQCSDTASEDVHLLFERLKDELGLAKVPLSSTFVCDNNKGVKSRILALECNRLADYSYEWDEDDEHSDEAAFFRKTIQTGSSFRKVKIFGENYLLIPNSRFLMSDIRHLKTEVSNLGKFDFITIDPPWSNKSIKRKKSYYSLRNEDLAELPVKDLSKDDALIACWVTCRKSHHADVISMLFPAWGGFTHVATYYWLKVTKTLVPVCDMESKGKKPYECVLFGVRGQQTFDPQTKIMVSVPSLIHSSKPPLKEVVSRYLKPDSACLEMFARNLTPGFTSWGNEVLKLQREDYFEKIPTVGE